MKIIIIEGPDNTGKSTIIHELLEQYNNVKIKHCTKPKCTIPELAKKEQTENFEELVSDDIFEYFNCNTDLIIHNRSFYGEYVYGCMYREIEDTYAKYLVYSLENVYTKHIGLDDVYLITLLPQNPEFLVKNEDGKSISDGKLEKITEECNRFKEIHEYSTLKNKMLLYIENNGKFINKNELNKQINDFINDTKN